MEQLREKAIALAINCIVVRLLEPQVKGQCATRNWSILPCTAPLCDEPFSGIQSMHIGWL
jgi:hypothetical protein